MKTMSRAALQRRLQVGVKLKLVWRSMDGAKDLAREVIQVQTNGVYMKGPDCPRGWLSLEKGMVIFETANGFELQWFQKTDGITRVDRRLRYEWTQPEQLELPQAHAMQGSR
jgi:hypothetical protein